MKKSLLIITSLISLSLTKTVLCSDLNNLQEIFSHIYNVGMWGHKDEIGDDSVSGGGSRISSTKKIRTILPEIIQKFNIKSMLDIPCGDWHWMRITDLGPIIYYGADIVPDLVLYNQEHYGNTNRIFLHLDLTSEKLPCVDLILCRDCLAHLSLENVLSALKNIKRSGAIYLLVSNFNRGYFNQKINDGEWQPLNLLLPPFNFPQPLLSVDEKVPMGNDLLYNKHLYMWKLADLDLDNIKL